MDDLTFVVTGWWAGGIALVFLGGLLLVRDTRPSTNLDAAAISGSTQSPIVVTHKAGGHGSGWYSAYCTAGPGEECDEYPFNSTYQGGPVNHNGGNGSVLVQTVPWLSNQGEGNALTSFRGTTNGCGISDGDDYAVIPMPTIVPFPTTWSCS